MSLKEEQQYSTFFVECLDPWEARIGYPVARTESNLGNKRVSVETEFVRNFG